MEYVNWFSIIIAIISSLVLRIIWYGPILFDNKWKVEMLNTDKINQSDLKTNLLGFSFTFVYCFMLAKIMILTDYSGMADGLKLGFMIGTCFSAMSLGIIYQLSRGSVILYFIDAGYMVVSSTIMGAVIGVMGN